MKFTCLTWDWEMAVHCDIRSNETHIALQFIPPSKDIRHFKTTFKMIVKQRKKLVKKLFKMKKLLFKNNNKIKQEIISN